MLCGGDALQLDTGNLLLRGRQIFTTTLILLTTVLGSTILKPDLDLSLRESDVLCDVCLLFGRDVSVGDVMLLQL